MMMTSTSEAPKSSLLGKLALMVFLAAAGAAVGYALAEYLAPGLNHWSDEVALILSALLIAGAVGTVGVLLTRPAHVPRGCGVLQAVVLFLAGLILLAILYGDRWMSPGAVFGLVAALLAGQSLANLMLWRAADEMLRRVMVETSALAFWALQLGLCLYAAGERLGLTPPIDGWSMLGVTLGVYLAASIVAGWRRGLR